MITSNAHGPEFSDARLERLTQVMRADVDAGAIPGAVVSVHHRGQCVYFEAFGYTDRTAVRPMQRDSIFRIASMTKPLTAAAALLLMERGELTLADPVSRYIPELHSPQVGVEGIDEAGGERRLRLESARRPITVQDLMRHTAGFTYGQTGDSLVQREYVKAAVMDPRQTNEEMVAKLAKIPLVFQPGSTFEYGMSTDVLGRLIEVVARTRLDRFFAEQITGPLGMVDTGFSIPAKDIHRLAQPHQPPAGESSAAKPFGAAGSAHWGPVDSARWFSGGGGLLSTAADYSRFCRMLLGAGELDGVRLLSRKTVELMTHNHLPPDASFGSHTPELGLAAPLPRLGQGYGLAVGVRTEAGLSMAPGSVGDFYWGGVTGPYFWVDPCEKLTVVFMLQEPDVQRRTRYRSLLRALVYQALS